MVPLKRLLSTAAMQLFLASLTQFKFAESRIQTPESISKTKQTIPGDVMIGALMGMHIFNRATRRPCSYLVVPAIQWVEALHYALDKVNNDEKLLPNITLGLEILDTCFMESEAIAQAMQFIPEKYLQVAWQNRTSHSEHEIRAVVGDVSTSLTTASQKILMQFQTPQVSPSATNPNPGADTKHPYLFKLLSPERFKARAIVDLLVHHNWTYVSLINGDDVASFEEMKFIMTWTREAGICLAYSKTLSLEAGEDELNEIARGLYLNRKARVIIMTFTSVTNCRELLRKLEKLIGKKDYFIYILDGSLPPGVPSAEFSKTLLGSFGVMRPQTPAHDFHQKFVEMTVDDLLDTPLGREYVQMIAKCSWTPNDRTTAPPCANYLNRTLASLGKRLPNGATNALIIDSLLTIAHGLHNLIAKKCPDASFDKSLLKSCITGRALKAYLHKLNFSGVSGQIAFDKYGDGMGGYLIGQFQSAWPAQPTNVAQFDRRTDTLLVETNILNIKENFESTCSKRCKNNERKIILEVKCCWECLQCRENEILIENGTKCQVCPERMWPESTFRKCLDIEPSVLDWSEPIAICLTAAVPVCVIATLIHLVLYALHRESKVIKASSFRLSLMMLLGNLLGYLTVLAILTQPSPAFCYVQRFFFNLSYTLVYGPLLVKSSQIYHIFAAGKQGKPRPRFVSSKWQVAFSLVTIGIQIAIVVSTSVIMVPEPILRMPVRPERYVELLCDLPMRALFIPLSYNILLVLISAAYGYKTRHLPNNFNESKYIFLSVCATLFLWIAFLPTYVLASNAKNKTVILALSLLINGVVINLCLFLPRVYALYYVDENVFDATSQNVTSRVGTERTNSKVTTIT